MARQAYADAVKPQRSHGYGAIVFFTLLATLGGIGLLCLELNEYDWQTEAKVTPVQKVTPIPPPEPLPAANKAAPMDGGR